MTENNIEEEIQIRTLL